MYYIATKLENHALHNALRDRIKHPLTYDWTKHGPVHTHGLERVQEVSQAEVKGVQEAKLLIVLLPGGRGTHIELGVALVLNIPTILYARDPYALELNPDTCAFYHHPNVILRTTSLCNVVTTTNQLLRGKQ